MKKKILSILLSIGLVLTMAPATVFAETEIDEVNLTIEKNFDSKTMTITPAEGEKGYYDESELKGFSIYLIDKEGNFAYGYQEEEDGTAGWTDGEEAIEETDVDMGNIDFIIWFHYLTIKSSDYIFAADVVPKVNGETLNAVTKNEDNIPISTGYDLDTSDYQGITFYIREDLPDVSSGSLVIEPEESKTVDLEVDYTYLPESNTAEKVFNVTVDYTFPASLDAKGDQNTYTWDPVNGKYTKDELKDADKESYVLSNEGTFEITLTNHSNVDIDYEVSYEANEESVFLSKVDEDSWEGEEDTIYTVAVGQMVEEDEIDIEYVDAAIEGNTDFDSATCTGTLVVYNINEENDYNLQSEGTDILGTFTISIAEAVEEEEEKVLVEDLLDTVEAGFSGLKGSTATAWTNTNSATCFVDDNVLKFSDGESNYITAALDTPTTPDGDNYKCMTIVASTGVSPITNITFTMSEGKLVSITTAGSSLDLNALYGEYSAPTE